MNEIHPRIISLAPTQTEIVAALGAGRHLIGVTENCDFPEEVRKIRQFGSWYSPDINAVIEVQPDLVLTFGSHHDEVRLSLEEAGIRVYHSNPPTIAKSFQTFREIAALIGREAICNELIALLDKRLNQISIAIRAASLTRRPSVFRIMNWSPLITPGPGAFQHDIIEFAGGSNVAGDGPAAYFVCDAALIRERDPEIIFFCEPGIKDFLLHDPDWRRVSAVRNNRIFIYDCGLTCRSGPRIVDMAEALHQAIMYVESLG